MVEELVTQPLSLMRVGDKPGYIDEIHRNEPVAVHAVFAFDRQVGTGTFLPHVRDAEVRVYGRERVVGYLGIRHGRSFKECRFPAIGLSGKGKSHHDVFLIGWKITCPAYLPGENLTKFFHSRLLKSTYDVYGKEDLLF
jgi:hypothetical protein